MSNSFINNFNNNFSALKWKESLDDVVVFMDGMRIPCLLIENKRDLVKKKKKEKEQDMEILEKFAKDNGFIGSFRTSAKTGKKVSEAMEFLINNIINRMETLIEGESLNRKNRRSVQLDPKNHTKAENARRKKKRCC